MSHVAKPLTNLFRLERTGLDTWIGTHDSLRLPQLFGGQLVGQSIIAASESVDDKSVHSTHTIFLRSGISDRPVTFRVERLRDGRRLSSRDVSAWQGDRLLCRTVVSLSVETDGLSHARPAPIRPDPYECPTLEETAESGGGLGEFWDDFDSIEVRVVPRAAIPVPHAAAPPDSVWMRSVEALPEDPAMHMAVLAYASDLMLMSSAATPHGHTFGHERSLANRWEAVSLDHSLWFRGTTPADQWLLFEQTTPMAGSGLALIEAAVSNLTGDPVCHVAQEALFRDLPIPPHNRRTS